MLFLILLMLLGIILIIYQIFFTKQIYKFILKVQGDETTNKSPLSENECYNNLSTYKFIYYSLLVVLLLLSLVIGKYLELKAWILIYYLEWIICLLYMKLNFSFIIHFLDVKFIPGMLDKIEKEFIIGRISNKNYKYILEYRLLNKKINI